MSEQVATGERADLLESLTLHRSLLRRTVQGVTDEQAARCTTVSDLCLGGLIKHVAHVEERWSRFMVEGPSAMASGDGTSWAEQFRMADGETLAGLLDRYAEVARRTDGQVAALDLDATWPLPPAPWFTPGARWSVRRVLLHLVAETAQHAGHADIIREALDGAETMA